MKKTVITVGLLAAMLLAFTTPAVGATAADSDISTDSVDVSPNTVTADGVFTDEWDGGGCTVTGGTTIGWTPCSG